MKFLITYDCFHDGETSTSQFEFESDQEPEKYNKTVREAAMTDSIKFHKSGSGSINIKSVTQI